MVGIGFHSSKGPGNDPPGSFSWKTDNNFRRQSQIEHVSAPGESDADRLG
jgi:hypothetical protein